MTRSLPDRIGRVRDRRCARALVAFVAVAFVAVAFVAVAVAPAAAVTHLERGMTAPVVTLADLTGAVLDPSTLEDRTIVLVFGELYHERTLAACEDVRAALERDALAGAAVTPLLVVAQSAPATVLEGRAREAGIAWRILHDVDRRAFSAYRVAVMPSVVVIDGDGRVVHALAGYTERFGDVVTDAMLLSAGRLSPEQFERSLHPGPQSKRSEALVHAERLTSLARQLARRRLPDLAQSKYIEAIELAPTYEPARLGLGMLQLERGRLADAELEFRTVLLADPGSVEARLGIASIQTLRGGDELAEAETLVRSVLSANATNARAHYLLGLVRQQSGLPEEAAASFRTASELLFAEREAWARPLDEAVSR